MKFNFAQGWQTNYSTYRIKLITNILTEREAKLYHYTYLRGNMGNSRESNWPEPGSYRVP